MAELHLYDFDGTLFRSPQRPDWWGKDSWIMAPESLGPPCVPLKPGRDWWIGKTVQAAKQSISDRDTWAILCTGRPLQSAHRLRVGELLKQAGLNFDEVYLNPGDSTGGYKVAVVSGILAKHPQIDTVHVWEDNLHNIKKIARFVEGLDKSFVAHPVRATPHEVVCTEEDVQGLADEGWSKWRKVVATRVAARWLRRLG